MKKYKARIADKILKKRPIELTPKPCFHYNYGQPVA